MSPTVTEIVFVRKLETAARLRNDLADHSFSRVDTDEALGIIADELRIATDDALNLETMEVRVRPPHGGLNALVQLVDRAVLNLNASPNRGRDMPQSDFKLVETLGWRNRTNPVSILDRLPKGSDDAAQ